MNYFPIFLDARKQQVLVIGGGNVAARKIELLLKTPAQITVLSLGVNDTVQRLIKKHDLRFIDSAYQAKYLVNKTLIIAATNDALANARIANDANKLGLLINVVDSPALCNYITPAIIDRSPMLVAISSEGSAPILLQMLRNQIETSLPAGYGELANFCKDKRIKVQQSIESFAARKQFWQQVLTGEISEQVMSGNKAQADALFTQALTLREPQNSSKLTIIQLQNNKPDNLTLKAFQTLQRSDEVYLDDGVSDAFYDYVRRDANKYHQLTVKQLKAQAEAHLQVSILIQRKQHSNDIDFEALGFTSVETLECGQ